MDTPEAGPPSPEHVSRLAQSPAWGPWPGEVECPSSREAFDDYWAAGPSRNFNALLRYYHEKFARGERVPVRALVTLRRWREKYSWEDRIKLREEAVRRGEEDPTGCITLPELAREQKAAEKATKAKPGEDAAREKRLEWQIKVLEGRIKDTKTPANAIAALITKLRALQGDPTGKEDSQADIVGLPPGHPQLTFDENEYLYHCISKAQTDALAEIVRVREERMNPGPLRLLPVEGAGG